jgi:agmatinase
VAAAFAALLSAPAAGQSLLGHKYELEAAPIREGERPVIPLDEGDPSYNVWRQLRDLRGYYPDEESFKWMRAQGFRYHTMAEIEDRGFGAVMEDVIKEAQDGPEYMFVSFDIDALDPSFVPGTGTPEPGGLTPREAFPIVRRLCAESNVVGFELVELAPMLDPTYVSKLNANRLIKECMTGIAMRKKGLTEPHYLSPLTKSHGQNTQ